METNRSGRRVPSFRELYPNLNDTELAEAEENFARYLEVVLRIYDRIQGDSDAMERLRALTESRPVTYDESQRSNPHRT